MNFSSFIFIEARNLRLGMHNSRLYVKVCKANNWAKIFNGCTSLESASNQNEKHTSQPLIAARIALRPRERLKLPRMKVGNPSDSKAETGNDIVYQETSWWHFILNVICT